MTKKELADRGCKEGEAIKEGGRRRGGRDPGAITGALKKGEKVQLVGFGTFEVRNRKARIGINPQTKAKITDRRQQGTRVPPRQGPKGGNQVRSNRVKRSIL